MQKRHNATFVSSCGVRETNDWLIYRNLLGTYFGVSVSGEIKDWHCAGNDETQTLYKTEHKQTLPYKCLFLWLWTKGSSQYTAHMNTTLPHKNCRPTRSEIIWSMTKQTSCGDLNVCILERKQRMNNITVSGRRWQCNRKQFLSLKSMNNGMCLCVSVFSTGRSSCSP